MMKIFLKLASAILLSLLLVSCSLLSPVPTPPVTTYVLDKMPAIKRYARHRGAILITPPETTAVYDTAQMAYRLRPFEVAYYAKNSWAQTPSQMLYPLMIQAVQKSNAFAAVITPNSQARFSYVLNTHILKVEQDYTNLERRAKLVINAQLVNAATSRVRATRHLKIVVRMKY